MFELKKMSNSQVRQSYLYSTHGESQTENFIEFQIGRDDQKCYKVKIHSATYQGDVRDYMEDAVVYTVLAYKQWRIVLCIVMDGHGGFSLVEFCTSHFVPKFKELIQRHIPTTKTRRGFKKLIVRNLKHVISQCAVYCHNSTKDLDSGTTLSLLCFMFDATSCNEMRPIVVSANVGDSPIYGYQESLDRVAKLSVDHSATTSKRERQRLEESKSLEIEEDGYIGRDGNSLAMTRSIGDHVFGDEITPTPYVRHVKQVYDKYLLYSDGISDVMKVGSVLNQMKMTELSTSDEPTNVAEHILAYRNSRYEQHDNTSIIYISVSQ